ncbi:MAG: DUF3868 domain-containing protein [Rikenellaceae bacterium]
MRARYKIAYILLLLCIVNGSYAAEKEGSLLVQQVKILKYRDELIVAFNLKIDRDVKSNKNIVLTPTIVSNTSFAEQKLPNIYINGRRQHIMFRRDYYKHDPETESIKRKNGTVQILSYYQTIPYEEWMDGAKLELDELSCGCGIPIEYSASSVADINYTPDKMPPLVYQRPSEEQQKMRYDSGTALIEFPLSDTAIYPEYSDNSAELEYIAGGIDLLLSDSSVEIESISLHGYASPEGPLEINRNLSLGRTQAVKQFIGDLYDFDDSMYQINHTAEDWEGFEALLSDTIFDGKKQVMSIVLDQELTPDEKEAQLREVQPELFTEFIDTWFKILRRTDYVISYRVKPFTVEQSRQIYAEKPSNLSHSELFALASSHKEGSAEYNEIILKAVEIFPNDPIANFNAASVALIEKDKNSAEFYLQKVAESPQKDFLTGVLLVLQGRYIEADVYLRKAKIAGITQANRYLNITSYYSH